MWFASGDFKSKDVISSLVSFSMLPIALAALLQYAASKLRT
jgi:hypothetical protein